MVEPAGPATEELEVLGLRAGLMEAGELLVWGMLVATPEGWMWKVGRG